jgi:hypothetical protein
MSNLDFFVGLREAEVEPQLDQALKLSLAGFISYLIRLQNYNQTINGDPMYLDSCFIPESAKFR